MFQTVLACKLLLCLREDEMKIAIPVHQGRVAPVFDCCRRILIMLQRAGTDEPLAQEDWSMLPTSARASRLKELVVELVICGGISCWMEDRVRQQGIQLLPWVSGEVWEVLQAFKAGRLSDPCFAMPGRLGCPRHRARRRHGRLDVANSPNKEINNARFE